MIVLLNDYLGLENNQLNEKFYDLIYYNLADESGERIETSVFKEHLISRISRRQIIFCNLKDYFWIVDCLRESHDEYYCNIVYETLRLLGVEHRKILFLVSVDVDVTKFLGNVRVCTSWYANKYTSFGDQCNEDQFIEKVFCCLMRRPTDYRVLLAKNILDNNWPAEKYVLSCGSMKQENCHTSYSEYVFRLGKPYKFPILVDGLIDNENAYSVGPMTGSLINVIAETSSCPSRYKTNSFLTEKTFKCFALKQIPLWFGHKKLIQTATDLGYDIFDDIIDQRLISSEEDFEKKSLLVCNQLAQFINLDIESLNNLYRELEPRLLHNQDLTKFYFNTNKLKLFKDINLWYHCQITPTALSELQ